MSAYLALEGASAGDPPRSMARNEFLLTDCLILLFIAVMPAVNVFSASRWVPPPMLTALVLLAWLLKRGQFRVDGLYLGLCMLCAICFLPWTYSAAFISSKTLLHGLAILIVITVYYAAVKRGLCLLLMRHDAGIVLRFTYFALLAVSVYTILEFLGINGRIWDLSRFIPYSEKGDFEALAFGIVRRPRGFASEPGVMALYYDLALFLVLPMLRRGRLWTLGYVGIILPAYLSLFSTASVACVLVAMVGLTLWNFRTRVLATSGKIAAIVLILGIVFVAGGAAAKRIVDEQLLLRLATFATGSGEDVSAKERRDKFKEISQVAAAYPLGVGFGVAAGFPDTGGQYQGITLSSGQISLYGTFIVAGGIPAGILLCAIIAWTLRAAIGIPEYGPYVAAGGLALSLHQLAVTEFWLPFLWFFFALTKALRGAAPPVAQPSAPISA